MTPQQTPDIIALFNIGKEVYDRITAPPQTVAAASITSTVPRQHYSKTW